MRLSQAKGEPAKFRALFGEILTAVHPEYERNSLIKGVREEYTRELAPGIYASHNAYCKKGTYYHGFCITLHLEKPDTYLNSPFTAGGRFDHNLTIAHAISNALGKHVVMSATHQFRSGCEKIIEKCTSEAEKKLLPFYFSKIKKARKSLRLLAERVISDEPIPEMNDSIRRYGDNVAEWDFDMLQFAQMHKKWRKESSDFLDAVLSSKPDLFQLLRDEKAIDPNTI